MANIEFKLQNLSKYNLKYIEVRITGNLDKLSAPNLDSLFKEIKSKNEHKNILVVFSNTTGMDSTGIALLANFCEEFKKNGINIQLTDVPRKISQLFEMLGLNDFFIISAGIKESLASFLEDSNQKELFLSDKNIIQEIENGVSFKNKPVDLVSQVSKPNDLAPANLSIPELPEATEHKSRIIDTENKRLHTITIKKKIQKK